MQKDVHKGTAMPLGWVVGVPVMMETTASQAPAKDAPHHLIVATIKSDMTRGCNRCFSKHPRSDVKAHFIDVLGEEAVPLAGGAANALSILYGIVSMKTG